MTNETSVDFDPSIDGVVNGEAIDMPNSEAIETSSEKGFAKRAFEAARSTWDGIGNGLQSAMRNEWAQRAFALSIAYPGTMYTKDNLLELTHNFASADMNNAIASVAAIGFGYLTYRVSRDGLPHVLGSNQP